MIMRLNAVCCSPISSLLSSSISVFFSYPVLMLVGISESFTIGLVMLLARKKLHITKTDRVTSVSTKMLGVRPILVTMLSVALNCPKISFIHTPPASFLFCSPHNCPFTPVNDDFSLFTSNYPGQLEMAAGKEPKLAHP